jgi:hypothetical protein
VASQEGKPCGTVLTSSITRVVLETPSGGHAELAGQERQAKEACQDGSSGGRAMDLGQEAKVAGQEGRPSVDSTKVAGQEGRPCGTVLTTI